MYGKLTAISLPAGRLEPTASNAPGPGLASSVVATLSNVAARLGNGTTRPSTPGRVPATPCCVKSSRPTTVMAPAATSAGAVSFQRTATGRLASRSGSGTGWAGDTVQPAGAASAADARRASWPTAVTCPVTVTVWPGWTSADAAVRPSVAPPARTGCPYTAALQPGAG